MKYYAFISYRHRDEKWAIWLQNKLERYRLPSVLCREHNIPKRLKPVCRDKTDLSTGELYQIIHDKLDESRFLIVVCSPEATKSEYINDEIRYFADKYGKDRICPLIVKGTPYSNDGDECFPEALLSLFPFGTRQILGANISAAGQGGRFEKKQRAFIMILSRMLEVSFDSLWGRHKKYLIRKYSIYSLVSALLLTLPLAVWNWTKAFDMNISLQEMPLANQNLPIPEGEITLCFDCDTIKQCVSSFEDPICFSNLPGEFKRKSVVIRTDFFGFESVDSVITAKQAVSIGVDRNVGCFGHIEGVVLDKDDHPVCGAGITIEDCNAVSDISGHFSIDIPLPYQQTSYRATVAYASRIFTVNPVYPMQQNPLMVNTLYIDY